jgi:hypothetical protein
MRPDELIIHAMPLRSVYRRLHQGHHVPDRLPAPIAPSLPPRATGRATRYGHLLMVVERHRLLTWVVLAPGPYDRAVATASPSPTPNPDATKFTLDTTLPAMFNVTSADAAIGNRFAEDVFAASGVASVFGVNDFVTVTRQLGADWGPIVAAVQAAAAAHL